MTIREKFEDLLNSVLSFYEANDKIEDLEKQFPLNEENETIYKMMCQNFEKEAEKLRDLEEFKKNGGTREEWLSNEFKAAYDKVGATEEQRVAVTNIVNQAIEMAAERNAQEAENYGVQMPRVEMPTVSEQKSEESKPEVPVQQEASNIEESKSNTFKKEAW